ncbi:Plasmodium exported protein (Pm-fam-a like), unknown function [Plasmodium ovale wallikeri]|uniref:Uncharacterized protein n=1 Tax=Plasmodium ovale wallikeri TaxID=864142 RepID=A0A1A9AH05_PLAOA|nr:Plasmodium exported protein (Pm-fam-a like), unknown function [Plasmodium ovale wallikeri]SBT56247.1 Plasmodium exported protein (Pm-fam-a like), unknown function [Plasmodium ovale wallikeri]
MRKLFNKSCNLGRHINSRNNRLLAQCNGESNSANTGLDTEVSGNSKETISENEEKNASDNEERGKSEYEQLTECTLDNVKYTKKRKKKSCIYNPFKSIDSYFGRSIAKAFGITVKYENNKKVYDFSCRKLSFKKILLIYFIPSIIFIIGYLILEYNKYTAIILSLLGIIIFIITYFFIKGIKYAFTSEKKRKNKH